MKKQRPKNLNLLTIRFPIPAIISILHRISGIILFLLIPIVLWGLSLSLSSQENYNDVISYLTSPGIRFLTWCCLSALIYHLIAGIRHLLMDVGVGEELRSGRFSAMATLVVSIVFIILAGIWLW